MNPIIPFSFESHEIRVTDQSGASWFVLRDLLDAMQSKTTTTAAVESIKQGLGEGFVNDIPLQTAGGAQAVIIVAEPAATYLLSRSNTEKGRELNRFIHVEVLPAIRKTGSYHAPLAPEVRPIIEANRLFRSNLSIAKLVFKGNQALLSANQATLKATGADVLGNLGATHLLAPERDALLTATDIGKQIGLSGQQVNARLEAMGLIWSFRDSKNRKHYEMTDQGAALGETLDTGKRHSDGTPVKQIKWYSRVVGVLNSQEAA